MKITNILGIDVSKDKLDCHLYLQGKALEEETNDEKGYRKLCTWLKKFKLEMEQLLVVMEYTGIYTYGLERYLHKERIAFVKRPALDIKRSLGTSFRFLGHLRCVAIRSSSIAGSSNLFCSQ